MALRTDGYEQISESPQDVEDNLMENPDNFSPDKYANKQAISLGMMDIALTVANASQLKYMIRESKTRSATSYLYTISIICICICILLQVLLGVLIFCNSRYSIRLPYQRKKARRMNNAVAINTFLITFIIIFGEVIQRSKPI